MKSKIVNFNKRRLKKYIKDFYITGEANDWLLSFSKQKYYNNVGTVNSAEYKKIDQIVARHNARLERDFFKDLENLKDSFCTESAKFKFPTILAHYKRGINPVRSLYNELQKVLFCYDKNNCTHQWILSLFKDDEWVADLMTAIDNDISSIVQLLNKWSKNNHTTHNIKQELKVLAQIAENLNLYKEVFTLVSEIPEEEL